MTCIAVQASPEDIKELRDTFLALDKDGSGSINFDELEAGLGHREDAETLIKLLRAADTDNSGSIDKREFRRALAVLGLQLPRSRANELFGTFDKVGATSRPRGQQLCAGCVHVRWQQRAPRRRSFPSRAALA